ncbi:MAG TPA: hypothetical protein VG499_05460, partial [Actinomycetota bacterium]|nr:hypothetical protein [Actinomycetota bacterium]
MAELMARIRVALHHARVAVADRPRLITAGAVTIDLDSLPHLDEEGRIPPGHRRSVGGTLVL